MPKPAVVMLLCPAADDVPQCNLHRASETVTPDASATALRQATLPWTGDAKDHPGYGPVNSPAAASGGGGGTLSPARMTPSPR